jgi:hypothetical protein
MMGAAYAFSSLALSWSEEEGAPSSPCACHCADEISDRRSVSSPDHSERTYKGTYNHATMQRCDDATRCSDVTVATDADTCSDRCSGVIRRLESLRTAIAAARAETGVEIGGKGPGAVNATALLFRTFAPKNDLNSESI